MIAPLHGPIWRSNLTYILDRYQKWASYTPEKPGVVIPYGSAYGNTASAVDYLAAELSKRGVEDIRIYDVAKTHPSYIIADIFKYSHVVFASITYNSAIFPAMQSFLDEMAQLMIKNRQYALIGNGSWSPMSSKLMGEFMANQSGWTNLADTITLRTTMAEDQKVTLNALADTIAQSIKAETVTN
ncbi:flavoprotein [Agrilactobacillus composti DSM 18527 = JCM 14202]|nr:flavodoxin domain-containing protein [Agrilactobacillus composti]GAF41565.1 flavoprotein [Agrilactobacillus composti DSM 18527 = JCM 14202]